MHLRDKTMTRNQEMLLDSLVTERSPILKIIPVARLQLLWESLPGSPNPHTWTAMRRWLSGSLNSHSLAYPPFADRTELMAAEEKVKNSVPWKWPTKAFLNQIHFVISSRLCWMLKKKKRCMSISKEKVPICYGLHTSHFPQVVLNNCFLWVPWHTVCVPINGPSHSLPRIPVICGPGDLPQ